MDEAPKSSGARKRPEKGGYARGDETRQKVIDAALEIFGTLGLEAASTRAITRRAGVNLPALHYYFGGKDGLYQACAIHIGDRMETYLKPAGSAIEAALSGAVPPVQVRLDLLHGLLDAVAEVMIGSREPESWVRFMIREQASPSAVFDILYTRFMSTLIELAAALLGGLMERSPDERDVKVRAIGLIGQIVFFRAGRETVLRALNWDRLEDHAQFVRSVLQEQIEHTLRDIR